MAFRIAFSGKAHDYTEEEIATVVETMRSAEPLTQGKHRDLFEGAFGGYVGAPKCFAVCNATAALEMAAQLCRFQPGDEIIIPSHTFTSSAYPFAKKGASIVWADIDPATRVVTPETIEPLITPRTKALVVVHLYGFMADMPGITALAKRHGIIVIEDAAQSLGTELDGMKSGACGDLGVYSLHSHKNITTLGEGGILAVRDAEMAAVVPMLRHNGHCGFDFERDEYWVPAMGNLDFPELHGDNLWPNNYCLGEIECALGIKLLERLDTINNEKRNRALFFIDELIDFKELRFHRVDSRRHNYHLLVASVGKGKRNDFIRKMAFDKGIQCVVQYYPLNRYPLYIKAGFGAADCPNAGAFFDNMVSFPFHHWMSNDDFSYMLQSAKEVLVELRK